MFNCLHKSRPVVSTGLWLAVVFTLAGAMVGCEVAGFLAHGVVGDEKKVNVKAAYRGLENQKVAVLVSVPSYATYRYPEARAAICRTLSKRLMETIKNVSIVDPTHILAFQDENPQWISLPYGELVHRLNVDRVVLVDVGEYSMTEPGNAHAMQGTLIADVGVIEAGDPATTQRADQYVFQHTVNARYPKDSPVGLVNVDEATMEVATLLEFTTLASNLFYDHQEIR